MNRLRDFFEQHDEPELSGDYYTVVTQWESFPVLRSVAEAVEQLLDQAPRPRWIVFTDLSGARHRLRARLVERVSESTAAQRSARRAFNRERRREAKADREVWEDDD